MDRKAELVRLISALDIALQYANTLPKEVRSRQLVEDLIEQKFMLVGYLGQVVSDDVDRFVKKEILGEPDELS